MLVSEFTNLVGATWRTRSWRCGRARVARLSGSSSQIEFEIEGALCCNRLASQARASVLKPLSSSPSLGPLPEPGGLAIFQFLPGGGVIQSESLVTGLQGPASARFQWDGTVIEVSNLTKYYGDYAAVQDVSFEVARGQIVGFLGPNGAGKTTTMRILAG